MDDKLQKHSQKTKYWHNVLLKSWNAS